MKKLSELKKAMLEAGYTCKMNGKTYTFYKDGELVTSLKQRRGVTEELQWDSSLQQYRWMLVSMNTLAEKYLDSYKAEPEMTTEEIIASIDEFLAK